MKKDLLWHYCYRALQAQPKSGTRRRTRKKIINKKEKGGSVCSHYQKGVNRLQTFGGRG
jgi:hypothetical protein